MLLALRHLATSQFGPFTAADARHAGHTREEVRAELAAGRWTRLRRSVYIETSVLRAAVGVRERALIDGVAVLLCLHSGVVLSHASAARLADVPTPRSLDSTVRLTDPVNWRSGRGYRVAQAAMGPVDVAPLGRFQQTALARTLVDCAREWDLVDGVIAMDDALHRELVTPADLRDVVLAQRHWEGVGTAARAAGLADGRAESPLESAGRVHIVTSGLPAPELQLDIFDGAGFVGRVDGWYEDAGVVVEFDGAVKYLDPSGGRSPGRVLWEEKRREDRLRSGGARPIRIADADLRQGWPPTFGRLSSLLATPALTPRTLRAVPSSRRLDSSSARGA